MTIMELERPAGVEKVQVFEMTGEKAVHGKFFIISHTVTHPSDYEYDSAMIVLE